MIANAYLYSIITLLQEDAGQAALDEEERLQMLLKVGASRLFRNPLWQVKNSLELSWLFFY